MAPAGNRNDPYSKFNFLVEIEGITSSGFLSVEGLETMNEVIDYRTGSEQSTPRKLPGYHTFTNIILRRGWTGDSKLWEWRKRVIDGQVDRRSGSVVILDNNRQEVGRFNFFEAWPAKWKGFSLDGKGNDVNVEEIELAVEKIERA